MVKSLLKSQDGFTLVELMISVSIFAFMTAFLVGKYGTFNQNILLTNLAYDVALTIRNAQSYGLNVRSTPNSSNNQNFSSEYSYAYGVSFNRGFPTSMVFFADSQADKIYTSSANEAISTYTIQRGSSIEQICAGTGPSDCGSHILERLDITFKRPDPNAIIIPDNNTNTPYPAYAEIMVKASDGTRRKVSVRSTGQIQVCETNNICR